MIGAQYVSNRGRQLRRVEWLAEQCGIGVGRQVGAVVACSEQHFYAGVDITCGLGQRSAADAAGQADIGEQQIDPAMVRDQAERLHRVGGLQHRVIQFPQHADARRAHGRVVLHHQDRRPAAAIAAWRRGRQGGRHKARQEEPQGQFAHRRIRPQQKSAGALGERACHGKIVPGEIVGRQPGFRRSGLGAIADRDLDIITRRHGLETPV